MKIFYRSFLLLLIILNCKSSRFEVVIPDSFYTVESELRNLVEGRKISYSFDYFDTHDNTGRKGFTSEHYAVTNDKDEMESFRVAGLQNCDIYLSFPRKNERYQIFIKKFGEVYKAFYYIQMDRLDPPYYNSLDSSRVVRSNVESKKLNAVFGADFIVKAGRIKSIRFDFAQSIPDYQFFDAIVMEE